MLYVWYFISYVIWGLGNFGWQDGTFCIFKLTFIYITSTQTRDDFNASAKLHSTDVVAQTQKWSLLLCLTK